MSMNKMLNDFVLMIKAKYIVPNCTFTYIEPQNNRDQGQIKQKPCKLLVSFKNRVNYWYRSETV